MFVPDAIFYKDITLSTWLLFIFCSCRTQIANRYAFVSKVLMYDGNRSIIPWANFKIVYLFQEQSMNVCQSLKSVFDVVSSS